VSEKPLDKALARILHGYSHAVSPVAGSDMPKVTIFLKEVKGAQMTPSDAGDSLAQPQAGDTSAVTEDKAPGDKSASGAETANESLQAASVPYDLDEYMPLPYEMSLSE